MSFILSSNMNLPIPSVGTEPGPQYAFDVNSSLTLIDQHDHSPGRGVQITPAGLNINTSLTFNGFNATDVGVLTMSPQPSPSTTPNSISISGGGESPVQQDLWYTPNTGTPIQITKNGIVNVVASSIPGESYASGTFFWTQTQDGFPNRPANFDIGSITIRPNVDLTTFGVTLLPNASISSQYNIVLPLLPASQSFMTIDNSGNIATPVVYPLVNSGIANATITGSKLVNQTITATQIANNTITTTQIASAAGILPSQIDSITSGNYVATSASSGAFSTSTGAGSPSHYQFVIASSSVTAGATYTNNSFIFTVTTTITSQTLLTVTGTGAPLASGTLTRTSGTGPNTIAFTQNTIGVYVTNLISIGPAIVTPTRPAFINFIGDTTGTFSTYNGGQIGILVDKDSNAKALFQIIRSDNTIISTFAMFTNLFQNPDTNSTTFTIPCGALNCVDTAPISGGSYSLSTVVVNGSGGIIDSLITNVKMQVLQV